MAPFNKRQIGYIQAIAGRQQHVTLIAGANDGQLVSNATFSEDQKPQALRLCRIGSHATPSDAHAKSLLLYNWVLDRPESSMDARSVHNNQSLEAADFTNLAQSTLGMGPVAWLQAFNAHVKGYANIDGDGNVIHDDGTTNPTLVGAGPLDINPDHISSDYRATPDGFLNSTDLKFRFTLPTNTDASSNNPMGQDHYEFRWIVWRNKKPTFDYDADAAVSTGSGAAKTNLEQIRDGASLRNPGYDLFMGQTGRKRGLIGYTFNEKLDRSNMKDEVPGEKYSGKIFTSNQWSHTHDGSTAVHPSEEDDLTVDDLLTMRLNRDDYVVMKDVRFFLGKEHGKSHFEDHLHWDWNDPIDTTHENVLSSSTLNDKNYRWHMTLIGTTGGHNPVKLNFMNRWTTKMESG